MMHFRMYAIMITVNDMIHPLMHPWNTSSGCVLSSFSLSLSVNFKYMVLSVVYSSLRNLFILLSVSSRNIFQSVAVNASSAIPDVLMMSVVIALPSFASAMRSSNAQASDMATVMILIFVFIVSCILLLCIFRCLGVVCR